MERAPPRRALSLLSNIAARGAARSTSTAFWAHTRTTDKKKRGIPPRCTPFFPDRSYGLVSFFVVLELLAAPLSVLPDALVDPLIVPDVLPDAEPEIEPDALISVLFVVSDGVVAVALAELCSVDWLVLLDVLAAASGDVSLSAVLVLVSTEHAVRPSAAASKAPIRVRFFFFMIVPSKFGELSA